MLSTNPDVPEEVVGLLKQAAAVVYSRPSLLEFAEELPGDDGVLVAALDQAALHRNAKAFSHLYLGGLLAGHRLPARLLAPGAPLLPEARFLLSTARHLEGDVAEALAEAVRSGRMSSERDAVAIIAGWLDYERRGMPAPPEFLALTRKICRRESRFGSLLVRSMLRLAAKLSGDPVVASILEADIENDRGLRTILKEMRAHAEDLPWENLIPMRPPMEPVMGVGATVKRSVPKAGRNDPCPCGSGKKFKQCCEKKLRTGDVYEIEGVKVAEAAQFPELLLTAERVQEMRSYELYNLEPKRMVPSMVARVAERLVEFGEYSRAMEMIETVGPALMPHQILDHIAYELTRHGQADALRRLLAIAPELLGPYFEMRVLLANDSERLQMVLEKAREAFEAERTGDRTAQLLFCDLAYGALVVDPALGILIGRAALPVCGWPNQPVLLEAIEDARDLLGLDGKEPGFEVVEAGDRADLEHERHAEDLEKVRAETASRVSQRDAEIQRLKSRIDAMQETLARKEEGADKAESAPRPAPPDHALAEARELRDELRRLKENLKAEHEERNHALRELRAAQDQMRRANREKSEPEQEPLLSPLDEGEFADSSGIEWGRQPLRLPEFSPDFKESLGKLPRHIASTALSTAGRLAGGDPSVWKTARALKLRPGTLRVRISGDYRLLYEIASADSLRVVDCILRRDLERWLSRGGR
jgi:mRNA-degrading endonuclease RelE of RelBE toxin-antitoxin system